MSPVFFFCHMSPVFFVLVYACACTHKRRRRCAARLRAAGAAGQVVSASICTFVLVKLVICDTGGRSCRASRQRRILSHTLAHSLSLALSLSISLSLSLSLYTLRTRDPAGWRRQVDSSRRSLRYDDARH
jgi:hypothetical protein